MGNYATKIVYHVVLAVLDEDEAFSPKERHRMNAIVYRHFRREGLRPLAQMCEREHLHVLVQGTASMSLQRLVHRVKTVSARWVNKRRAPARPFFWKREYLAFTVAPVALPRVRQYVIAQNAIHAQRSFEDERAWMLAECTGGNQATATRVPFADAAAVPAPLGSSPVANEQRPIS